MSKYTCTYGQLSNIRDTKLVYALKTNAEEV